MRGGWRLVAGVVAASLAVISVPATASAVQEAQTAIAWRSPTFGGANAASEPGSVARVDPWTNGFNMTLSAPGDQTGDSDVGVILTGPATGLATGTFTLVAEHLTPAAGQASVRLTGAHIGSDVVDGTLTVSEISRDGQGVITSLTADVAGKASGHVVEGDVRFHSTSPWSGLQVAGYHALPDTKVAYPSSVEPLVVTVRGGSPVTFGAATIKAHPVYQGSDDFEVVQDGCSGVTVQPDSSCTVSVRAEPQEPGTRGAYVVVPDTTSVGGTTVAMTIRGVEDATGTYYNPVQTRILDTRSGLGAPKAAVGAGKEVSLQVVGRGSVPAGVSAVVLNITAVDPSWSTYLTAYPSGTTRPNASTLNTGAHRTRANMVTLPVGADGKIRIYNRSGSTHMLADVIGFYAKDNSLLQDRGMGKQFHLFDPSRLFDSRSDGGALFPGETVTIGADFGSTEDNAPVRALALNVTALGATRSGFTKVYGSFPQTVSTLNFVAGQTVANMTITDTQFGTDNLPEFTITNNSSGTVHLIVDAVGVYTQGLASGLRYRPLAPRRMVDTRNGTGTALKPLGAKEARLFSTPSTIAGDDTYALVANTTAVAPTASTYLTVWAEETGAQRPLASNLNAAKGETAANATLTPMGPGNLFRVFNAAGSTPMLMDVSGTFEIYPSFSVFEGAGAAPGRMARSGVGGTTQDRLTAPTGAPTGSVDR